MRRYVVALCIGLGALLSGPVFAAEHAVKPMAMYAIQVHADMDMGSAYILPEAAEQSEAMAASSADESTRAALAVRSCGMASAPVPADHTGIAFVQSIRHRHPDAGSGGLALGLVRPNNDGLMG